MDQKLIESNIWQMKRYLYKYLIEAYEISPLYYTRIKIAMLKEDISLRGLFNAVEKVIYAK